MGKVVVESVEELGVEVVPEENDEVVVDVR